MDFFNVFLEHFVPILAATIGAVVVYIINGLTKKYGTKLDIEVKQRVDDLVASLTHQGVAYAEQWAKRTVKDGSKPAGNQKLHKAMEYIAEQIRINKLDEVVERQMVNKIEAVLGLGTLNENFEKSAISGENEDEENIFD